MKFKLNKIAAAMAVGLGTSVVGMNVAQADEILFPYVVASDTVTTILSVINDDDFTVPSLHYRYYYKRLPGAPTDNTAPCVEANFSQPTSPNDVVTFDVSGQFGDARGVLFEPGPVNAVYTKDFALFRNVKPVRAFAIVDNNDRFFAGNNVEGEAFIIQFSQGSVWGYQAYNAAEIGGIDASGNLVIGNPYDFSDRAEVNGEVMVTPPAGTTTAGAEAYWSPIAIMPFAGDEVQTALFVTPIATTAPFQLSGTTAATIGLQVNDPDSPAPYVMYDRDENPYSGQIVQSIVCVGRVNIGSMITEATRQYLVGTGGWSNVAVRAGQAVVMKIEFNDTAATLGGKPAGGGSYNNSFWLRKGFRESLARTAYPGYPNISYFLPEFNVPEAGTNSSAYPLIDIAKATAKKLPWPPTSDYSASAYIDAGAAYSSAATGKQL